MEMPIVFHLPKIPGLNFTVSQWSIFKIEVQEAM